MKNKELKIKLDQIANLSTIKLPGIIAKTVAKNKIQISSKFEEFEKVRISVCENLAEKDENGKIKKVVKKIMTEQGLVDAEVYDFSEESQIEVNEQIDALMEEEVEMELKKFPEGLLDQLSGITESQMSLLLYFSEETK